MDLARCGRLPLMARGKISDVRDKPSVNEAVASILRKRKRA